MTAPAPILRPLVCLLTEPDTSGSYARALAEAGFDTCFAPVLRFEAVNQDALWDALHAPYRYAGLVATSPRAIALLAATVAEMPDRLPLPVFVVGSRSVEAARAGGLLPVSGYGGTAEALARHIIRRGVKGPLLFLAGSRRRDTLPEMLAEHGIPLVELCVYKTHLRSDLHLDAFEPIRWLVFFSPSGIEAVQAAPTVKPAAYLLAAIGPTTAMALQDRGWTVSAVATSPTPSGVAAALREAEARRGRR